MKSRIKIKLLKYSDKNWKEVRLKRGERITSFLSVFYCYKDMFHEHLKGVLYKVSSNKNFDGLLGVEERKSIFK